MTLHRLETSEQYANCEQQLCVRLGAISRLNQMLDALITLFKREATFSRVAGVLVVWSEQQSLVESANRGNSVLDGGQLDPALEQYLLPEG